MENFVVQKLDIQTVYKKLKFKKLGKNGIFVTTFKGLFVMSAICNEFAHFSVGATARQIYHFIDSHADEKTLITFVTGSGKR